MKQEERDRRNKIISERLTGKQLVCPPCIKEYKVKPNKDNYKQEILSIFNEEEEGVVRYLDEKYEELILL
jgi:hypothetical protein